MNSLKQVLEMKNQLIHQQEKRIMELEKLVSYHFPLPEQGDRKLGAKLEWEEAGTGKTQ